MPLLSSQRVMMIFLVVLLTMQVVAGQNYHFSNGWHAGKKRSNDNGCGFRKDVLTLINKFILEETARSARQCQSASANMEFSENESIGTEADNQLTEKRWK